MFVKTKERAGRTVYFLCIPEDGGSAGRSWKAVEYSVCLGETLDLAGAQWVEILHAAPVFRSVSLEAVLEVMEEYVVARDLPSKILDGLREAAHGAKQKKSRRQAHAQTQGPAHGGGRSQEEARVTALRQLGLPPGSTDDEIESAFRRAARRHHPDVGGDSAKFQALLKARNFLLGREPRMSEPA